VINVILVQPLFQEFFKNFVKMDNIYLSQYGRKKKLQSNEIFRMKRIANENPFLYGREVRDEAMLNRKISMQTESDNVS